MTIDETLDYIYSFINIEKKAKKKYLNKEYSLNNIHHILNFFGNPQDALNIIHIAGTKGKGSTALFISKFLVDANYSTTVFSSPHLVRVNERFSHNNQEITDKMLIDITAVIKEVIERNSLKPTTFEFFFIIFLLYSQREKPDFAIIEVGLGGSLDCTNVVMPILSVITPIGIDHTEYLGSTIEKIAAEKGGIIKHGGHVVCSYQKKDALDILCKISEQRCAKFYSVPDYFSYYNCRAMDNGINFDFSFEGKEYKNYFIGIMGTHQIENFATALLSLSVIKKQVAQFILSRGAIRLSYPGRIQILKRKPLLIVDVAHNEDSAEKLANTLQFHFKDKKWQIVCGLAEGKNYDAFFKKLAPIIGGIYISPLSKYKTSNPKLVFEYAQKYFDDSVLFDSLDQTVDFVANNKNDLLVTGSFYLVGPVVELLSK